MAEKSVAAEAGEATAQRLLQGSDPSTITSEDLLAGIEALWRRRTVEAADALARIEQPKDAAKAARRALFKLQSVGIRPTPKTEAAADAQAPERPAAKLKLLDAQVSSYDPRGTRAIFILAEKAFAGLMSLFVIASDSEGLLDADLSSVTKKAYSARIRNFESQYDYIQFVSIPPEYALHLVHQLAARNEQHEHHHPWPQDYSMWNTLAGDLPAWEGPAPVYTELDAEDVRKRITPEDTKQLADEEFAGWGYDEEQLKEYVVRIQTTTGGPLVVSSDAQKGRVAAIVDDAVDGIFQGDELARAKERLEETAYFLLKQGNREGAERCLRAALSVPEGAPHEHPFLKQLIVKSLDALTGGQLSQDQEPSQPEPARTESGIILPA